MKRHLEALSLSHEARKLKPDSTKSSKNDSKSSKAQYVDVTRSRQSLKTSRQS